MSSGENLRLIKWLTVVQPYCKTTKLHKERLAERIEGLGSLQNLHYASSRYALLPDASGDGRGGQGRRRPARYIENTATFARIAEDTGILSILRTYDESTSAKLAVLGLNIGCH